jgi:hypothetical protein
MDSADSGWVVELPDQSGAQPDGGRPDGQVQYLDRH